MPSPAQPRARGRIDAITFARTVCVLWIFLIHVVGASVGFSLAANPGADWETLEQRWAQWAPVGSGFSGVVTDLLRWVGWLGENAVGVFLFVSGVLLTLSIARADSTGSWIRKRFLAIIPGWIIVNFGLAVIAHFIHIEGGPHFGDKAFWLGLFGIRFLPQTMYYGCAAWWYVGMLFQLYLIFPFLYATVRRLGINRSLLILLPGLLVIRGLGLVAAPGRLLEPWASGGIVISRLPEVLVGMLLTLAFMRSGQASFDEWLRKRFTWGRQLPLLVAAAALSFGASFTLAGMTVMPVLGTTAYAVLLLRVGAGLRTLPPALRWFDARAWEFYLVHMVWVFKLVPHVRTFGWHSLVMAAAAFLGSVVTAELLHRAAAAVAPWVNRLADGGGRNVPALRR